MKKIRITICLWVASLFILSSSSIAQVTAVEVFGITVKDMDRSVKFYSEILGFKKISDQEFWGEEYEQLMGLFGIRMRVVRMQLGDEFIELTDYLTSGGRSIPEDVKSNDLIFQHIAIVVSDMDKAYSDLKRRGITHISTGPQTIPESNKAAAGIKAFYFQDPDMHTLELIFFPKGKGLAKWQQRNKLFLGIDHSAIAISNTDQSLQFYTTLLGLEKKGESHNEGTEQAHLNFVKNATVHITGLRSGSGPGVEFLQYLYPGTGKKFPADSRTDDIWHWQTILIVDNIEKLYNNLRESGYSIISSGIISLAGSKRAFLARDPDGHALLFRE